MAAEITAFRPEHFDGLDHLWRDAFPDDPPWNRAESAVPAKLLVQPDLLLVALDQDKVVGSIMGGYDGHRGWLYAVAVLKPHRRTGLGARLVSEAEQRLQALGCSKINLQVRSSNTEVIGFYEALGYHSEERVSMGKRLHADVANGR
jgi:ribosomal protein S18 acetylase RimI-like enzyme